MIESGQWQRSSGGRGGRMPDWYHKRPREIRGDAFWIAAFNRLATCRQVRRDGFGPIPWTAVHEYAVSRRFSPGFLEFFEDVLLLMDQFYRERIRQQQDDDEGKERRRAERKAKQEADRVGGVGARRR